MFKKILILIIIVCILLWTNLINAEDTSDAGISSDQCLSIINNARIWVLPEGTRNNLYYKIDKLLSEKLSKYSSDKKIQLFELIRKKINGLEKKTILKREAYEFLDLMMYCYIKKLGWDNLEDSLLYLIWNVIDWWWENNEEETGENNEEETGENNEENNTLKECSWIKPYWEWIIKWVGEYGEWSQYTKWVYSTNTTSSYVCSWKCKTGYTKTWNTCMKNILDNPDFDRLKLDWSIRTPGDRSSSYPNCWTYPEYMLTVYSPYWIYVKIFTSYAEANSITNVNIEGYKILKWDYVWTTWPCIWKRQSWKIKYNLTPDCTGFTVDYNWNYSCKWNEQVSYYKIFLNWKEVSTNKIWKIDISKYWRYDFSCKVDGESLSDTECKKTIIKVDPNIPDCKSLVVDSKTWSYSCEWNTKATHYRIYVNWKQISTSKNWKYDISKSWTYSFSCQVNQENSSDAECKKEIKINNLPPEPSARPNFIWDDDIHTDPDWMWTLALVLEMHNQKAINLLAVGISGTDILKKKSVAVSALTHYHKLPNMPIWINKNSSIMRYWESASSLTELYPNSPYRWWYSSILQFPNDGCWSDSLTCWKREEVVNLYKRVLKNATWKVTIATWWSNVNIYELLKSPGWKELIKEKVDKVIFIYKWQTRSGGISYYTTAQHYIIDNLPVPFVDAFYFDLSSKYNSYQNIPNSRVWPLFKTYNIKSPTAFVFSRKSYYDWLTKWYSFADAIGILYWVFWDSINGKAIGTTQWATFIKNNQDNSINNTANGKHFVRKYTEANIKVMQDYIKKILSIQK